jgi:hypothetical protein
VGFYILISFIAEPKHSHSGPATIVYDERGYRADEEEPESFSEDELSSAATPTSIPRPLTPMLPIPTHQAHDEALSNTASPAANNASLPTSSDERSPSRSTMTKRGRTKGRDRETREREMRQIDQTISGSRSSSKLAEALSSVWGAFVSPKSPSASSQEQNLASPSDKGSPRAAVHSPVLSSRSPENNVRAAEDPSQTPIAEVPSSDEPLRESVDAATPTLETTPPDQQAILEDTAPAPSYGEMSGLTTPGGVGERLSEEMSQESINEAEGMVQDGSIGAFEVDASRLSASAPLEVSSPDEALAASAEAEMPLSPSEKHSEPRSSVVEEKAETPALSSAEQAGLVTSSDSEEAVRETGLTEQEVPQNPSSTSDQAMQPVGESNHVDAQNPWMTTDDSDIKGSEAAEEEDIRSDGSEHTPAVEPPIEFQDGSDTPIESTPRGLEVPTLEDAKSNRLSAGTTSSLEYLDEPVPNVNKTPEGDVSDVAPSSGAVETLLPKETISDPADATITGAESESPNDAAVAEDLTNTESVEEKPFVTGQASDSALVDAGELEDPSTNSTSVDEAGSETPSMGGQQDSDALTQPQSDFVQGEALIATSEPNASGGPSADAGEKPVEATSSNETETDENNSEDAG